MVLKFHQSLQYQFLSRQAHPKARPFWNKGWPLYDIFTEIYGQVTTNGKGAFCPHASQKKKHSPTASDHVEGGDGVDSAKNDRNASGDGNDMSKDEKVTTIGTSCTD
jgi:hypothetical protein